MDIEEKLDNKPERLGDVVILDEDEFVKCNSLHPISELSQDEIKYMKEYFNNRMNPNLLGKWVVYAINSHSPALEPERIIPKYWFARIDKENKEITIENPRYYSLEKGSSLWNAVKVIDCVNIEEFRKIQKGDIE